MEKKAISGIMLTLLLVSMLTFAFGIHPVKASETIYIMADGSVNPSNAPIQRNGDIYTFTADIYDSIVVEKDNIIVDGDGYTLQGTVDHGFLLSERSNVTIKNTKITGFSFGITLYSSFNNTISNNTFVSNQWFGISIAGGSIINPSSNNTIMNNSVSESACGIQVHGGGEYYNTIENNKIYTNIIGIQFSENARYNVILGNSLSNNDYGFMIMERPEEQENSGNRIFHNNFVENTHQAVDNGTDNTWDDGYPSGGNYWSDYSTRYPDAHELDDSGIWDTPYVIDENNQDNYPLMEPWTPTPPTVTALAVSPTSIIDPLLGPGSIFRINITVADVQHLWGYQFILSYETDVLTATDFGFYPPLTDSLPSEINDVQGYVALASSIVIGDWEGLTALEPNPVAWIEFVVDDRGASSLDLHDSILVIFTGSDILMAPHEVVDGSFDNRIQVVMASLNVMPDALNLRSKAKWITVYIQLPEEYNAADINATTILLNGTIAPVLDPKYGFVTNSSEYLVDHNNDGILERMVKFDRATVESWIYHTQGIKYSNVALTITGKLLDGTRFEGTDVIFVNYAGDANNDGKVNSLDIGVINANWGTNDSNADLNCDGRVNSLDTGIINANWGQTVP